MKISDIQQLIFDRTGVKTTVSRGIGSMKGYAIIRPLFQGGKYPEFNFDLMRELTAQYPGVMPNCNFFSISQISLYMAEGEPLKFKKERRPEPVETMGVKSWGSKNSQLRLDKAAARYAKRIRRDENCARYY